MDYLFALRNVILTIIWVDLFIGSIYIFVKGRTVYKLIKTSLVGKLTWTLVFTTIIEMYSLAVISTAFMLADEQNTYIVLPIFMVWFILFLKSLKVLQQAKGEAEKIIGENK